jgi:hypothetical protein
MNVRDRLALVAVCACGASLAGALAAGCGGGGGSGGSDPPSCGAAGQTPCPPSGPMTTVTASHNYAVHKLFLGDVDPVTGAPNPNAWQNFGYNLDGKNTTAASTDVCRLVAGAPAKVQIDGPNGIDNSFGANLIPIIVGLESNASALVNASITQGQFTIMTDVTGFDDSAGNMTSAAGLGGVVLAGANVGDAGPPTFLPSFNWPVSPDLLDCAPNCPSNTNPVQHATVKLSSSYQAGGTFVSGTPTQIDLALTLGGQPLKLTVLSAIVTFQPSSPGHVTNGIIAGVIQTEALIASIHNVLGFLGGGQLCSGNAVTNIENEIRQKSDIVVNGNTVSNDPGTTCNGISVGLGFQADEIAQPTTVAPATPPGANPCGGQDGGGD